MSTSGQHAVNVFRSQNSLSLSQQNIASRQQKISEMAINIITYRAPIFQVVERYLKGRYFIMEKLNLLDELEGAESYLSGDMQQLSYIQDNLESMQRGDRIVDIPFVINSIETLFKAMLYNQQNMKNAIDKAYSLKKLGGTN